MEILESFVTDHISSHVIRCSFCANLVRRDVPFKDNWFVKPGGRGENEHERTKREVATLASNEGWQWSKSTHGITLNFCPDHVHLGREMGVLRA